MKAIKQNKVFIFLMLAVMACAYLTSCKIIKPGTDTTKTDETTINYKPVDVPVKGAKVGTALNVDSLVQLAVKARSKYIADSTAAVLAGKPIPPPPPQDKKTFTDPQTKAELSYWIDQYGKLQVTCESKDQVVTMLTAEVTRLTQEVTKKTEVIKETPVWCYIVVTVLATLLFISGLLNLLTLKRK